MNLDQFASMTLYEPLLVGSAAVEYGDITWACWPSYRRQSLAMGGDHIATFTFSAADDILERWFDDYLACHFEESFAGVTTFVGLIWSMRLSYNGVVLTKSLDNLANSVRVTYQTGSAGSATTTTAVTDAASIARYGTKEHLAQAGTYITSTMAGYYAANLLATLKQIRATMEEARLTGATTPGTLQVEVRGYSHTLNWRTRTDASTSAAAASTAVSAAISTASYVTAGSISSNTATVSEECTNQPVWDRIKAIAELGGNGSRWLAGCYQGRALRYAAADESTIAYEQEMRSQRRLTFIPGSGELIPAALVQPGGVMFVRDLMPGRPQAATLLDDPRSLFIEMVEYSQAGAVLKGAPRSTANKAYALAIALAADEPQRKPAVTAPPKSTSANW